MAGGLLDRCWQVARRVALGLLAGVMRWRDPDELRARIAALPPRDQAAIVVAVLSGLFLVSLLFARIGLVGMLLFLLLVVIVVD